MIPDEVQIPGYEILACVPNPTGKLLCLECKELGAGGMGEGAATLFPGNRHLRIKRISQTPNGLRLEVKGCASKHLVAGAVMVDSRWPIAEYREALLMREGNPVPVGPGSVKGSFQAYRGTVSIRKRDSFLHIAFPHPYPLMPGMVLTFSQAGKKSRRFTVLFPGTVDRAMVRRFDASARRRPDPHPSLHELYGRIVHVIGQCSIPPPLYAHRIDGVVLIGTWWILADRFKKLQAQIIKTASVPGGALPEQMRIKGFAQDCILAVAKYMVKCGDLVERNKWLFPPGPSPLSPFHRSWLARVNDAGTCGFKVRDATLPSDSDALAALGRADLILGGKELWFSKEAVAEMADKLFSERSKGEIITMTDARSYLGGSRASTLELLEIFQSIGRLHRDPENKEKRVL